MKIPTLLVLSIFMYSCSPLVQKAYFVESPNVAAFDTAKVTNVSVSGQYASNTNIQLSHSFTNNLGMTGSIHFGYQRPLDNSIDYSDFAEKPGKPRSIGANVGFILFKNFPQKYFELSAFYGFQMNNNRKYGAYLTPISYVSGPWLSHDVHSLYHRVALQPAFLFVKGNHKFGLALRNEIVYCPYYFYEYELTLYDPESPQMISDEYTDRVTFYDKYFVVFSPFVVYRFSYKGIGLGMHAGITLHSNACSSIKDTEFLNPELLDYVIEQNPTMAKVVFGIDLSFSFRKKHS